MLRGDSLNFDEDLIGETTFRAIIDPGLLDVDETYIGPIDRKIKFIGDSSDMIVIDLGDNKKNYKVGDLLEFKLDYMGVLRIINSRYIEKRVIR